MLYCKKILITVLCLLNATLPTIKAADPLPIQYICVLGTDMGSGHKPTPAPMVKKFEKLNVKLNSKTPSVKVLPIMHPEDLTPNNLPSLNLSPLTRYIFLIFAHGGGTPFQTEDFIPEQSPLMLMENVEFAFFSCLSGNLEFPPHAKAKVMGASAKNAYLLGHEFRAFMNFLAYPDSIFFPATPYYPESAQEIYALYHNFQYQTALWINYYRVSLVAIGIVTMIVDSAWGNEPLPGEDSFDHALRFDPYYEQFLTFFVRGYINSWPAIVIADLTSRTPLPGPWYKDPESALTLGDKEWPLIHQLPDSIWIRITFLMGPRFIGVIIVGLHLIYKVLRGFYSFSSTLLECDG